MTLKLIGSILSPFVRKARVFLAEKSVEYELEPLVPFMAPTSFTEISPLRRVPVLRDSSNGVSWALPDSSAICGYLEHKYPDPSLYPRSPADYGRALWFEEYADTEFSHTIGQQVFGPVVVQRLLGSEPDMQTAENTFHSALPSFFRYLESSIGSNQFLVGNAFGIADISVGVHFQNLNHAGFRLSHDSFPNLSAFVARVLSRPSFQACLSEETSFLRQQGFAPEG
ncbi:MAG: glutathione S-transferase family protein [Myxococcota bacterium]